MRRTLTFSTGRRAKWLVLAVALVVVFAAGSQAGSFEEAQDNTPSSYLPGDSDSLRAGELSDDFPSGDHVPAVVVYARESGLTTADRARVEADRAKLSQSPPERVVRVNGPRLSEDGSTALLRADIDAGGDNDEILEPTQDIRELVRSGASANGLAIEVTGSAGFAADQIEVFESIDGTLLLGTALMVLVLLILIYRSPVFWLVPFTAALVAEIASRGLGYGLTELGVTVNGQSAAILVVLVFGVGTDYALLLVARYREELRRHEDRHEAMAVALQRAAPAIVASGFTVIAALLCLVLADVNGTAGLGPIAAVGVALAMLTMLTLLPALVLIAGRRAFWPFVPRLGEAGADETHGFWRGLGERVARRPRRVWAAGLAVLALMAGGLAWANDDLTIGDGFREDVEAVQGQELLQRAFPAGASVPASIVVPDPARAGEVRSVLSSMGGVAGAGDIESGPPGARFDLFLASDPYSEEAFGSVPELRRVAEREGGAGTLVGGPTAEEHDLREATASDNRVIVPAVLLVILVILGVLLRAVTAPLVLIATVIASYAAAVGVGAFAFEHLLGFEGMAPSVPLFAFIFLVALGVDYNIFLMARVREETLRHGTREGMVRGLAVTGSVITSAGLVLAGTFTVLAVLPLVELTQIGLTVAFGILLDTFLVRSLLVPALVLDIDRRTWWPSALWRRTPSEKSAAMHARCGQVSSAVGGSPPPT